MILATTMAGTALVKDLESGHTRLPTDEITRQAAEIASLNAHLETLAGIGLEFNVTQDTSRLVERYCKAACALMGAGDAAACLTGESDSEPRYFPSGAGASETGLAASALSGPIAEVLEHSVCRRGQIPREIIAGVCEAAVASYLLVPIMTPTRTYGWLGIANKIGYQEFTAGDERVVAGLAAQLAVEYENSRLFEQLKSRATDLEYEIAERRQSGDKYRMLVERASDGISLADEHGDYIEVNARMLEMLGYSREEFLRLNMRDMLPKDEHDNGLIVLDQTRNQKMFGRERRFLRNDGSILEVEISMSELEDGRVQEIVRDIGERKRSEVQIRHAHKLEAVGRLAGGMAHDFNNLLTVILGHSEVVISAMESGDSRRRNLGYVREAGLRAALLAKQLLAFSRKQFLHPKVMNIDGAVANLTEILSRVITSNIEVLTKSDHGLWSTRVDPGQLDQVLLNLAMNARDAMPLGGKLIIETANRHVDSPQVSDTGEMPPGDYVMMAVSDTGSGMDAETRSHLFEPFFTTKLPGSGTGLGLATIYGIVQQSGGYICVESEPGAGTSMKVYLPRALAARDNIPAREDTEALPRGSETVLLAEDEQHVRSLVAAVLTQQGYNVIEASDGDEALKVAKQYAGEIHLLFTDLMMPKITGRELAEQLRRDRPAIKVLLTSGYADDAMQQGVLDGSPPFLQKPFTPRILAIKVREALDTRSVASMTAAS